METSLILIFRTWYFILNVVMLVIIISLYTADRRRSAALAESVRDAPRRHYFCDTDPV